MFSFLIFVLLPIAKADVLIEIRNRIEQSYTPEISFDQMGSERSLYGCSIEKIQLTGKDPITTADRQVHLSIYHPRRRSSQTAVLVMPPTGGVNILDRGYANEFCSNGLTAVIVSNWSYQNEFSLDYSMHNNGALRALAAIRHVVEYLTQNNFGSIGLLGTSIGAVAGSLALSFEPRITAAAFIAGAAEFREIITTSDETGAKKLRAERMKAYGIKDLAQYRQVIRDQVWIDPSDFLKHSEFQKTLVITADNDTTVLTSLQLQLVHTLQPVHHYSLGGDHLRVIKDSYWKHRGDILSFFKEI